MESNLKRLKYQCEALGVELEIQQLSALALSEIIDEHGKGNDIMLAAITCKHGVVGWREYSAVEVLEANTVEIVLELAGAIDELTQDGTKKNLEKGRAVVSSLG